jgi:mannose/fructose/N-acetylgalactosamine-specific phosphotransferase system component IID
VALVTGRLGFWDLFRVFLRLLFMQGLLNWRGMQNLGLASALGPASGKLGDEADNSLLANHLGFFNCNPNFVPLIVGGVLRMEEEKRSGNRWPTATSTVSRGAWPAPSLQWATCCLWEI